MEERNLAQEEGKTRRMVKKMTEFNCKYEPYCRLMSYGRGVLTSLLPTLCSLQ